MSLFCGVELAARIERAEADLIALAAARGFVAEVGGGVAACLPTASPLSKVAGLGFAPAPTAAELDAVEGAFAAAGAPVQAEVASLADPAVGEVFSGRGYRLVGHEHVLGRALQDPPAPPPEIEVRLVDEGDAEAVAGWVALAARAGSVADERGVASHERVGEAVIAEALRDLARAGLRHYLALRDGVPAGAASLRLAGGIAQLTGAATLPAHRRRGVQAALLAARLADAGDAGAEVAVVTTRPGSTSQQNAVRQGFTVQYSRGLLVLNHG